jgi:hypothetical protein
MGLYLNKERQVIEMQISDWKKMGSFLPSTVHDHF